ncbi:MAG: hypothetical protein DRP12_00570 [Candidatus Aenigmatarchaeota archaeon]|nr:MAG: hypothetical protein DRP12_00570 [Candidatus Aenigmarchaeota archaeon]
MERLVVDEFRDWAAKRRITGIAICGAPFEMEVLFDYTCLRGCASNLYLSFVAWASKEDFRIRKVDEWVEVTPLWPEFYAITMGQKEKLQTAIKTGLTSAAQAVADYELLSHDARRYREILDYFLAGKTDETVLRSLFVDRVDAYTGEGYSLITMARRWPTIITDFIRMKEEWTDIDTIRRELDVSQAEATVLKTKNELYKEWKKLFFPTVKERYARIMALLEARKKSIEEYKNWLKPYIARFKMIREKTEEKPTAFLGDPLMTPGFAGQTQGYSEIRIWVWKPITPAEIRKPSLVKGQKGFVVYPYDDLVKEWKKKIEERYGVEITDEEVENILKKAVENGDIVPERPYYELFDISFKINFYKSPPPEGIETDNPMIYIKTWFMSVNVLLMHLIELYAREKVFEKYVNELIGAKEIEEEVMKKVEEEFEEKKEKKKRIRLEKMRGRVERLRGLLKRFVHFWIRPGPYETVFYERISKGFARGCGADYGMITGFFREKMGIK